MLTRAADLLLAPFAPLGVLMVLLWGALLTAVLARAAFALASPRRLSERGQHRVLGALLGFWLHRGAPVALFRQVLRLLRGAGMLAVASLPPLALMLLPAVALFVALEQRAQHQPLQPGDVTLITELGDAACELPLPDGLVLERRAKFDDERVLRVRVDKPGAHRVVATWHDVLGSYPSTAFVVPVIAEPGHAIRPARTDDGGPLGWLFDPGQLPGPVRNATVSVQYPPASVAFGTWRLDWLVVYLLASFAGVWVLPPFPHRRPRSPSDERAARSA